MEKTGFWISVALNCLVAVGILLAFGSDEGMNFLNQGTLLGSLLSGENGLIWMVLYGGLGWWSVKLALNRSVERTRESARGESARMVIIFAALSFIAELPVAPFEIGYLVLNGILCFVSMLCGLLVYFGKV